MKMNEMLQLSQLVELSETSATWLPKSLYISSQALVNDLLAHVANLNSTIPPEDLYEVMLLAAESFRTASPLHVEYRIQHASLGESWLKASFMPDMQENGTLLWHGIITEATKHKHMENVLEHLYKALDSLTDPVFVKDREHRWVFLNDACCQMIGHDRDELIGKTDFDFFPEHEAKIFWEKDEAVFSNGQENINEETLTDSSGNKQTILTRKTRYTDSNWQHFLVGIISNITERKHMEALLADRERGFRAMIECAPDNVARYDRDLRILNVNPALEKTLGQPVSALIGRRTDELYPDSPIISEYYQVLEQVLNTGQVAEYLMISGQDGFGRPLYDSIRIAPEIAEDGSVQGVIAIGRDLSSTRNLEMQVAASERELRMLIDNTPDIIVRYDLDCRRTWMNESYERTFSNLASVALGKKPTESWGSPRMAPEEYERLLREVMLNGKPSNIELDWFTSDKEYVCYSVRVVPEFDAKGEVCSVLTFGRDVSELKRAGLKIQASEQEFRTLVENSPNMTVRYDRECRRVFVNPAYEKVTGVSKAEALGGALLDSWVPENISSEAYKALLQKVMASGEPTNIILEWMGAEGVLVSHDMRVVPEYDVNGKLKGTLVIGHNISRLRRAEIELTKREQEFRVLVEHSPDTINRYDHECRCIYASPSIFQYTGVSLEMLMHKTPEEFLGGEQARAYQDKIRKVLDSGIGGQLELTWHTFSGKEMCSHIHLTPEFDAAGKVISVLAVGRDITEIDAYRKQIHSLAYSDPLTHLPNRSLLSDLVYQTVVDATSHGHQFGLMVMDLDRFKEINDTLGHSVGDKVLCEAAQRLQSCVRGNDTVARMGGDEFAILLPEIYSGLDLDTIACKILVAFNHPFIVDGCELFITTSIGITLYPNDSADVETLFRYADSAMYHAKQQGRNNFQFYSADLTEKAAVRMSVENDLRKAQERNELELYYQPQVELASGKIIGAEALLRWNHSKQGMVTPDKFIPVAEEAGLIIGIGEWVLHSACQAAVAWNTGREIPLCIAVNLSTRQFIRNDLVATVQRILQETACQPSWIKLEITESLLLEDSTEIAAMLDTFNNMGHAISIDDFGTGYSALSYLNRFPVSQIKIDRSFVQDIPNNHEKTELVKVMISIAQVLKMELVAEGVETKEQADCLLTNSCPIVQGYLFGKPMPYAEFEVLMASAAVSNLL